MATKKKSISVSSKKKAGGPAAAKKGASRKKAAGPAPAGKKSSKKSAKKTVHTAAEMKESSLTSGSTFDTREELSPFGSRDVAPPAFSTPQVSGESEGKQGSMPIIALVLGAIVILVAVYVAKDIFFPAKSVEEPTEHVIVPEQSQAPSDSAKPSTTAPAAEKPAAETTAPAAKPEATAPAANGATKEYVVKKGDSLYGVAKAQAHDTSAATIAKIKELNGLKSNALKVGQTLKIPVK